MACFLVTAAEAVVVTAAAQGIKHSEKKAEQSARLDRREADAAIHSARSVSKSRKAMWLAYMLWGGALLLAFEHIWHGEVVPWFPFLTNAANPADAAEMLHEMATIGVTMAVLVTAVWAAMVAAANAIVKRVSKETKAVNV